MWQAIYISDQLIDEFLSADIYVMGIPMYNFNVPSTFKAYIDQIVRVGRTYNFEPEDTEAPYKPLVHGKKMFIITARGASYTSGERYERLNHQDPHLLTVFGFIGITDITFIHIEKEEFGEQSLQESIKAARNRIAELVTA